MATDALARLTRSFAVPSTRRAALGALLGSVLMRSSHPAVGAKGSQRRRKRQEKAKEPVAAQAKHESVTITVLAERGADGTFVASGAFSAGGTVSTAPRFSAGGAPDFLIIHATEVFTDASGAGTFTLKRQVKVRPSDTPGVLTGTGTWVVIGGTGVYAGLHGQGTLILTLDETSVSAQFTFTFTGSVHGV